MLIGYARVSTDDQNLDLQRDALKAAGCERLFEDLSSGAKAERTGLFSLMAMVRSGDTVVIWRLDRLGRSLKNLIELVERFEAAEVGLRSLQENIDTTSSGGRLVFHLFGALAEFERSLIRERTQAGLAAARVRGRMGGRPKRLDPVKLALALRLHREDRHTIKDICKMMGISKSTCITTWPRRTAMPTGRRKQIPSDSLLQLRQRLDRLPHKSPERAAQVLASAALYGVSPSTVYRALQDFLKPRAAHRVDHGTPRLMPKSELQRYCELVAALKLRTTNKAGRHLSTKRAIELLEEFGVETAQGLVRAPPGVLTRSTVNEYLTRWHLDQGRLRRQPPAVRFQAERSNDCWQFDMSPSDLKHIAMPSWVDPSKGEPTLMLYSVVDDRSGVCFLEYRCV